MRAALVLTPAFVRVATIASAQAGVARVAGTDLDVSRYSQLAREIEARRVRDSVPALAVAVVKHGRIVWDTAFGRANLSRQIPASASTRFPIGSVTKTLTSSALMVLARSNRVMLDERANRYLGDAPILTRVGDSSRVTVRALASHTSGIARHDWFTYLDEPAPPVDLGTRLRRYARVTRSPGETYEYSNLNYMALARIIASASSVTFEQYLARAVLMPLGMRSTTLGPPHGNEQAVALSYNDARVSVPLREVDQAGAGGYFSTAGDLAKFARWHLGAVSERAGAPLRDADLAELHTPRVPTALGEWYAIGWRVNRATFTDEMIYHTGSNGASASIIMLIPSRALAIVALANAVTDLPGWVASRIVEDDGGVRRSTGNSTRDSTPDPFAPIPFRADANWRSAWTGRVEVDTDTMPLRIVIDDSSRVSVQLGANPVVRATGVRLEGGFLRASIDADIPPATALGRRYRVHLKLARVADSLVGSVTAATSGTERVFTLSWFARAARAPRIGTPRH
jgi:CubicO group peptidase (beta-lactamase class C family)